MNKENYKMMVSVCDVSLAKDVILQRAEELNKDEIDSLIFELTNVRMDRAIASGEYLFEENIDEQA